MTNQCKTCGSPWHSAMWHKPRKPLIQKNHCTHCDKIGHTRSQCILLRRHKLENDPSKVNPKTGRYNDVKPLRKAGKYTQLWGKTRAKWITANPANHQGMYQCHYCHKLIPAIEMTLDHKQSRSRHPELRYELSNLVPCCSQDNEAKGSRSHDEYEHTCYT